MLDSSNFIRAAKLTAPVFFGYISIGIPFGLLVVSAGFPWWLAAVMSVCIYSGTGQYVAVALFSSGLANENSFATVVAVFLGIEFCIGLRHSFYSLSLIEKFRNTGKWRVPIIFTITDETFAIISSCTVPKDADKGSFYAVISILDYFYWIAGTLVGTAVGQLIPAGYLDGVDFALTALFIVLMLNQIRAAQNIVPSLVGILTAASATALSYIKINGRTLLSPNYIILTGLALGISVMIFINMIQHGSAKKNSDVHKNKKAVEK